MNSNSIEDFDYTLVSLAIYAVRLKELLISWRELLPNERGNANYNIELKLLQISWEEQKYGDNELISKLLKLKEELK